MITPVSIVQRVEMGPYGVTLARKRWLLTPILDCFLGDLLPGLDARDQIRNRIYTADKQLQVVVLLGKELDWAFVFLFSFPFLSFFFLFIFFCCYRVELGETSHTL